MNAYAKSADSYLIQRVLGASPEQQAALLMEAGQRFLGKALQAYERKDHSEVSRSLIRVTEIINECYCRLNHEDGGELVENLTKMYGWWSAEIMEASKTKEFARLKSVSAHMGEIRLAWEQLHEKNVKSISEIEFQLGTRVV